MFSPSEILALFEQERERLGLSQAELGKLAFGKADNSAIQGLKRGSSPSIDRVKALADALKLELYLGPPRDSGATYIGLDSGTFAEIPVHFASLSAGGGHENGPEGIVDYMAFRREWLRRIGVSKANAVMARAVGDSMQPTLWDGDMVLIDTSKVTIPVRNPTERARRSPIFALLDGTAGAGAKVKRVERPTDNQLMLLSDNPDYAPQLAEIESIRIIGKVMWWGHTSKE